MFSANELLDVAIKLEKNGEAVYRDAADDPQRARELRDLGGRPGWFFADWAPLPDTPEAVCRWHPPAVDAVEVEGTVRTSDNG